MERTMDPMHKALRALMQEKGYREHLDLAVAADVTSATVSRYLSSQRGTRMNSQAALTVEKLAQALGVQPEYFLEYRQAKAETLVREAMAAGKIDLDDIELIIARHDLMDGQGRGSS